MGQLTHIPKENMKTLSEITTDRLLAVFLLLLSAATITDLIFEDPQDLTFPHIAVEGFIFVTSLVAFLHLFSRIKSAQKVILRVNHQLHQKNEEAAAWKKKASVFLKGLSAEIQSQFDLWRLTNAEREVALLLLKGFSHREIAQFSDRSERTIRQHSGAVYQKSGLTGRAELAAFFLEDLLAVHHSAQSV